MIFNPQPCLICGDKNVIHWHGRTDLCARCWDENGLSSYYLTESQAMHDALVKKMTTKIMNIARKKKLEVI